MYKGKRYNLVMVCLLLVISLVAGASVGMSFTVTKPTLPELDNSNSINPGFEEVNSNQTFNGLKQPGVNASAQKRLAYALAVMDYGKGYTSESLSNLDVLGNNQYVFTKRYRTGEYNISEVWYKMTGILSGVGMNHFTGTIKTPSNVKRVKILDSNYYSFDNRSYDTKNSDLFQNMTISELTALTFGVPINDFFSPINPVDSPVIYDNKGRGTNYYEIKVKLNGEKLKPQFFSVFQKHGLLTVDVEEIICIFKIDKKTGFFLRYDVDASFLASGLGLSGRAYLSISEKFLTMNKSALEIIKPIALNNFGVIIA